MAASQASRTPGVVLDTNVVLDWLLFADPGVQPLARALQAGQLRWLASPRMREELTRTLRKPQLSLRLSNSEQILSLFDREVVLCQEPQPRPATWPRCSDATDQVFVDLALTAGARWLVSHDRALRKLARRTAPLGLWIGPPTLWPGPEAAPARLV